MATLRPASRYLKASNTASFSSKQVGLRRVFVHYCCEGQLIINSDKTNVAMFSKKSSIHCYSWTINILNINQSLEIFGHFFLSIHELKPSVKEVTARVHKLSNVISLLFTAIAITTFQLLQTFWNRFFDSEQICYHCDLSRICRTRNTFKWYHDMEHMKFVYSSTLYVSFQKNALLSSIALIPGKWVSIFKYTIAINDT